mmetsp:Transcript_87907/g.138769  ORF Transcript_87907/g.138769 Transcript_87907/m.138769 type:complete len:87 (-) Transcript_87907:262-522(-)
MANLTPAPGMQINWLKRKNSITQARQQWLPKLINSPYSHAPPVAAAAARPPCLPSTVERKSVNLSKASSSKGSMLKKDEPDKGSAG